MKVSLIALCLFSCLSLQAAMIKIADINSDYDQNVTEYFIELNNQNHIDSLRYITTMPNGGIFEDVTVPSNRILNESVVVVERQGRDIVILSLEDFSTIRGGTLVLNYLYNGITGSRKIKKLSLKLVKNDFLLFDGDRKINKMFLESHRRIPVGIIGVKEIHTSFKK